MKEEAGRFYLSKGEISQLPEKSGVYFLYQKGGILAYIGKALYLKRRVRQHDLDKHFSYVGYELCHWSRARNLEKELLNLYKKEHGQFPYYNKVG
jgi:excinuclease UvrABC nuclease subunit